VQATNTRPRFEVTSDGAGIVGHAGAVVLAELSDRLGLTGEFGRACQPWAARGRS